MRHRQAMFGAIGLAALATLFECGALASPPLSLVAASATVAPAPARRSRAFIHVDIARTKAWLGQAIPITVSAEFRDVDGVTLEGIPQIKSDSVFTSDLGREPRQSTVVVDGQPLLVASWTGTITPSTAGPLLLSVELPVRIRFHDAAVQPTFRDPQQDDPFANMNIDPSDPSSIQNFFRSFEQSVSQSFEEPVGRAHDEAMTLKAATHPLEVRSLPLSGQPAGFSGAVGRFDIRASVATQEVRASEPVTVTVTVQGQGDLDRVEIPGVRSSADWKTYPTTSKIDAPVPGKKLRRKTFEQVLVPLHGGHLTIPSISLPAFDPVAGAYTTVETTPIAVDVEGAPVPAAPTPPVAAANPMPAIAPALAIDTLPPPSPGALVVSPRTLGLRLAPIPAILLATALMTLWRGRDTEASLRRTLRRTAKQGSVAAFFDAARRLIAVHFAKRWGVAEEDVTAEALRKKLGATAEPLVSAISIAEALRFGRRSLAPSELRVVCSSIEGSLREAT